MYVDRELVRRVEYSAAEFCARHVDALARLAPASGAAAQECDGGQLISFGPGRYVNRAMGVGLGGMAADEVVGAVGAFYGGRSLPASLEIGPWVDETLIAALAANGYRLERYRNVYVRDLESLPEPSDLDIRPLDAHTSAARNEILAFGAAPDSDARRFAVEVCESASMVEGVHDFVAVIDDAAVACGSLNIVEGIGWFGGAATLPAFQGRGLQQALLAYRLQLAVTHNCAFAACTAVPDGQSARNVERLGFQLLYTQTVLRRD